MVMKLEVKDATFAYNTDNVFEGLDLSLGDNEFFCILGPNGCGKTTFLKCLSRMLELKEGEVLLDSRSIYTMKRNEIASRIGYVPQDHSSTFPFTVLQVVLVGRAPYLDVFSSPSSEDVAIAEDALDRVGITKLKDKRFTELSGGERQLVLIARVLAQQPKALLLDEPTSHLDFRNQTLILRLISSLAREGLTVVMTTHFPNHAFAYSSRVAMMKDGKFLAVGRPEEIITEKHLKEAYGIDVRIFSVVDSASGNDVRFCIPAQEQELLLEV